MALEGKGFYIWKVQDCEDGDPARILRRAVDSGLSHVLVKIADGTRSYNANRARPVVEALKEAGLQVWGWQFVYGRDPYGEADIAIQRVRSLGVDGFVVNAEDDYKNNRAAEAVAYMDRLNAELGDVPVALSSYRYPNYHPELPWTEFLSGCDYNMPQVYWVKADDPDKQLDRSIEQFRSIFPVRPIIPTGSAYEEFGWRPQPDHIERLLSHARDLGLPAVNFWSWDYAGSDAGADFWEVIAGFDWPVASLQPDIADVFIDALNRGDLDALVAVYTEQAILVTRERTYRGRDAIRAHYAELLGQVPSARFFIETRVTEGWVRHVKWGAQRATNGRSIVGTQDTMQINRGLIQFHSTRYQIV